MKKGGFSGPGHFQPRRPHSRLRLGERHRLLQQELARECREVQLLEGSLARLQAAHTGGGGGSVPSPMPPAPALVLDSERQPRAMLPSPSPLPSPAGDSQPWALPSSPRPYTPPGYDSQIVPVVAPLPIRAHESPSRRRPPATAAATAKWRDVEAPALQPGHVPLSSLPVEGVTAILWHAGLHMYAEGFARLGVDGEMLADPTLHEEDLIELGVPIRLHRRRLLALVADFGRNGVPREALLSRPPGSSPKEDAATPDEPLPGPAEDAAGAEAAEQVAAAADPIQQELWAAARLELLAVEEEQELG